MSKKLGHAHVIIQHCVESIGLYVCTHTNNTCYVKINSAELQIMALSKNNFTDEED